MSQEIIKDPFEFCDSLSPAPNDECNYNQINNKLNLLLTKIERMDKNVLKLNQLVDMLISKETIMEMTLSSINADYIHTREIVHKTETSCSKILNIIEERALSYERAIEDAAEQIQTTITKKVPDRNFNQTDNTDENCTNLRTVVDHDNNFQSSNLNNDESNTVREIV
ncbi:unnamed protein product [Rotaria sp. Silwood2]|nr:unnamed protein product [Rotaria sp. Silwood2]CAF4632903.1 unnamed protein product [Rotaria sp. Silwood2]